MEKVFKGNKNFELIEVKATETDGVVRISGYANNKYISDRYGDIPTPFNREYVYELTEFRKNPILLLNHNANIGSIAGKITEIHEDVKGLYFEAEFTKSAHIAEILHAKQLVQEGILKTVSIGGVWHYEDEHNRDHLTLAEIMEISLVAVPADPNALVEEIKPLPVPAVEQPEDKQAKSGMIASLYNKITAWGMNEKLKAFEVKQNQAHKEGQKEHN